MSQEPKLRRRCRQQRDEPPQHPRSGTSYTAGEAGRIHRRGNEDAAGMHEAKAANVRG